MSEECWLVQSGEPHTAHDQCPGLLAHDEVIHLYFESESHGWSGEFSYYNWRKHALRTKEYA